MEVIKILDSYIEGNLAEGNKLLVKEGAMELYTEPNRNVHKLLLAFREKHLNFEVVESPVNLDTALENLQKAESLAEKYVYALYVLRFQNPVTATFVNIVLKRIDA